MNQPPEALPPMQLLVAAQTYAMLAQAEASLAVSQKRQGGSDLSRQKHEDRHYKHAEKALDLLKRAGVD